MVSFSIDMFSLPLIDQFDQIYTNLSIIGREYKSNILSNIHQYYLNIRIEAPDSKSSDETFAY